MRNSLALVAVVTAAVLATSCGGVGARSGGDAAKSSEKTASPPDPTPPAAPVRSSAGVWLSSLQMVSATTGWATLSTSNPNDNSAVQLGRTTDGGRTWALVTPPTPKDALVDDELVLKAVDARSAWLVAASPENAGGTTVVFHTVDSGRSWQQSAPVAANQPVAIDIIGRRGWLLESLGAAMGSNPVRVYLTTDGGLRWSLLARSQAFGQPAANRSDTLPLSCDKVGIAFSSARIGWIGALCNAGYSLLVTRDGGAHWASQQLPIPRTACAQAGCEMSEPQFAGHTTFLPVGDYPNRALLFVSTDAGGSWRTVIMPRGAEFYPRIRFFNQSDGIAVSAGSQGVVGRTFYLTSDAGLSWTAVPQGRHFGKGGASFDFVSPSVGFAWLLAGINAANPSPKVYRTSDSGRTWRSFVPRLG
jgi:photosystem II stability/assembly factor-like uncharacterized protein